MKTYVVCETCKTPFEAKQKEINRGNARFCSLRCSSRQPRKPKEPNCVCAQCGIQFYRKISAQKQSKSGLQFCTRSCKEQAQRIGGMPEIQPAHYNNGCDYREIAFRHHPAVCMGCGYDKHKDVLHVHHRDGDRSNNDPANLAPLCPTCHTEIHHGHRDLVDLSRIELAKLPCKGNSLPTTQAL